MKKINKDIDPKRIFEQLTEDISAIGNGMKNGSFSKEEVSNIQEDIQDLMLEGFKTKLMVSMDIFSDEQPNLSVKEIVVKMLDLLPNDVSAEHISILTNFVIEKWKVSPQKLAA